VSLVESSVSLLGLGIVLELVLGLGLGWRCFDIVTGYRPRKLMSYFVTRFALYGDVSSTSVTSNKRMIMDRDCDDYDGMLLFIVIFKTQAANSYGRAIKAIQKPLWQNYF
jgi:hypothetical protein